MNNSEEIDNCLFCLEEIVENYTNPKYCKCKIKLHLECLTQIEKNGLLCPICRMKVSNNEVSLLRLHLIHANEPFLLWFPFAIFCRHPNLFTFLMFFTWSFIVTIFYIGPQFIYMALFDDRYRYYVVNGLIFMFGFIGYNFFYN
jgi:hypothetical protein